MKYTTHIKLTVPALLTVSLMIAVIPALAQQQQPPTAATTNLGTKGVFYEQLVNRTLPLNLKFTNSQGKQVELKQYFDGKHPVILVMPFYKCVAGCTLELQGMAKTFGKINYKLGKDFTALTISINPKETPDYAARAKALYLKLTSNQPYKADGWHFMVGSQPNIQALAKVTGDHYNYDLALQQFVHPLGMIIFTPEGKIYRYFYGDQYEPQDLTIALTKASQNQIGSPIDQLIAICCSWNPKIGRYGVVIQRVIVVAGCSTVAALAILVGGLLFWEKKHPNTVPSSNIDSHGNGSRGGDV